jgi:hypothetical protein
MEATDIIKILTNEGIDAANNIRANMGAAGMWVTGETGNSIKVQVKQEGTKFTCTLVGRPYFMTVQTGRRPTPGKKPSRELISNITRWVEARGIDLNAVWAIAMTIQRRGTDLWLRGGRTDIVDPAVDDFINNVSQALADAGADDLLLKVKQAKW